MTAASPATRHRVAAEFLDRLGAGREEEPALALLRDGRLSKHLLMIRMVLDRVPAADRGPAGLDASYDLLRAAQARDPRGTAAVLLHPHVGAWAMHCLRALRRGATGPALHTDLGYLNVLAAVAAARAGVEFAIKVPVRDGAVVLPTLGLARLGLAADRATVRSHAGRLAVTAAGTTVHVPADPSLDTAGWSGLRHLTATERTARIDLLLDDIDPFRSYQGLTLSQRLSAGQVTAWQRTFEEAWRLLVRHHPAQATGIASTLRSLVPLDGAGRHRSATCPESFGAIAASFPPDAAACAATLVHEFQHAKLGALLDLLRLCDTAPGIACYAPWREDPRPVGALLHGIYAHAAVTLFWRAHRTVVGPAERARAEFEFALWREQTGFALRLLRGCGALTVPGRRFASAIADALAGCASDPVADEPARAAHEAALAHRVRWRLNNLRPDPAAIERMATAWRAGRRCPTGPATGTTIAAGQGAAAPGRVPAWTRRALTLRHRGGPPVAAALLGAPEIVAALHRRLRRQHTTVDPAELAGWLAPALPEDGTAGFVGATGTYQ
ncbi:HEXXH motif domain-containing protein [Gandjariella thermophila]|uniref:HEXXH motif domain-containing protein n=1 Tax=Gandjariella thermophila TaxID=1931992 RepID=A0A4D4J363_9PSEU|nr:HEXXH motif domain-containing protein [Gandjariella thermophila]GDY29884.1 HEXXH motif domain-containing protein [Gandjariella thermophila]